MSCALVPDRPLQAQAEAPGPRAHLAGSFDVEMVQPLQDGNPGHHADGRVTQVAVEHLHDSVKVKGHWGSLSTVGKTRRES